MEPRWVSLAARGRTAPIGERKSPPAAVSAAVEQIVALLAGANHAELEAMAVAEAREETAALARAARLGAYRTHEVVGMARVNAHYYVKARLKGDGVEPLTFQLRLGERDGRWMIWEAMNLSGGRSPWTR